MNYLVVALTPRSRIESVTFSKASALQEYHNLLAKGYPTWFRRISKDEAETIEVAKAEERSNYANV